MSEETNIKEVVEEIKASDEETLRSTVEKWFETTRNQGLKIGASYISAAIYGVIKKHIIKKEKASLRDYKRMTDEIIQIISIQLTEEARQNDLKEDTTEEVSNDE